MEKIAINPQRLKWCCETLGITVSSLFQDVKISEATLNKAFEHQAVLSINQLEKIADYFNQSLLFFIEKTEATAENIYSPAFRTINNQQPIESRKLRKFIANVEKQRKIYLNLLDDLQTPVIVDWQTPLDLSTKHLKPASNAVRQWLNIQVNDDFEALRESVENKGVMVIVSNGYDGPWQIDKSDPTRGFCLYYDTLPIIAIKKQQSKGAMAFTLMHELAHLLLHKTSMLDNQADFYSYQGREQEANIFASNLLLPDELLDRLDVSELRSLTYEDYDDFFQDLKKECCVSGDAILYRLCTENKITLLEYQQYRNFKDQQRKQEQAREKELRQTSIPRKYRHREPVNMFGRRYVNTVLNAKNNEHITLSKASTYLDNLKIHTLHKLERDFV